MFHKAGTSLVTRNLTKVFIIADSVLALGYLEMEMLLLDGDRPKILNQDVWVLLVPSTYRAAALLNATSMCWVALIELLEFRLWSFELDALAVATRHSGSSIVDLNTTLHYAIGRETMTRTMTRALLQFRYDCANSSYSIILYIYTAKTVEKMARRCSAPTPLLNFRVWNTFYYDTIPLPL